ncbi:MAG TPA: hypothetical protein VMX16_02130 [Terriglobia bacterium]|nr:hypothetical protein [Terriglobia bacterium]
MDSSKSNSKIRQSAGAVWAKVRMIFLPIILLGWAVDDTMKTLAAAIVFATAPEASRKHRRATTSHRH